MPHVKYTFWSFSTWSGCRFKTLCCKESVKLHSDTNCAVCSVGEFVREKHSCNSLQIEQWQDRGNFNKRTLQQSCQNEKKIITSLMKKVLLTGESCHSMKPCQWLNQTLALLTLLVIAAWLCACKSSHSRQRTMINQSFSNSLWHLHVYMERVQRGCAAPYVVTVALKWVNR